METHRKIDIHDRKPAAYRYGELSADSAMLEELLKTIEIQQLFESFYTLVNIPVAIIDFNANVLFSSRWQRICTQFHRIHPITCGRCIESDTQLATQLQEGKLYTSYSCRNGMTDCAAPIIIEGRHIANVFIGQFLTKAPDEDWFRRQAEEFGFDVDDYLTALHEVPIVEAERVPLIFDLLIRMARLITNLAVDRKRATESQAMQAIILNTIPQAVFWKDTQGRYLGCNAPFAKAAGFAAPDDVIGKTDFDLPWPRQEAEAYRADDLAVISANQPKLHIVEPVEQANGSRIVVDTSKIPLVGAGDIPYGLVGIYEDITERRQADDRIKASEEKFRKAFMTGVDAFYLATFHDGKILEANESFKDVFGYTREEAIGKTSIELGLYADPIDRQKWVSEMETTGQIKNLKLRCNKKGGIPITVLLSVSLLEGGDEQLILGVVKDITEQTQAQEALRESEAYRRAIFESARDAILIMRGERFIDCNPSALALFGADRESLVGHVPYEFSPEFQPDGRPSRESALEKIGAALNGVAQFFDWKHQRLDGTPFDAEVGLNRLDFGKEVFIQAIVRDVSEHKHAEEALRENELKYRALFETADDAILLFTGEQWVDCNAAALRVYGCTREQIIGAHPSRFSPPLQPDGQPSGELSFKRISLAYANEPQAFEWVHCRVDGTLFDAEVHLNRVDLGGKSFIQAIVRDVSSRKRAEEALKKSEERYRSLFDNSGAAMLVIDPADGAVVDANQAASRFYGWSCDELKSMHITQVNILSPEEIREKMAQALATQDKSFQFQHRRADGSVRDVEVFTAPIELEGRQLIYSIIHDISERKRAEEALNKSEERFQLSMDATNDGLWDWNAATNEVYYSPACYHMLGYEVGDFPETLQGWQELLHPDDIEHTMRVNMDCVEGRSEAFSVEYRLKAKNGEWHWILGRGKSIARDLQGRSLRLVGTNSDITERKQMEITLTETQAQIQAVMNSTEDMIWAVDPVRCGLLTFNQSLKKYFKERLNVDCQIGMTPEELLPPAFAAQWHDIYARALREGSFVMEYLTSSGVNTWMLTVNIMKRGEEVFGISVFSKDITEIKQAQAQILKLSRLYDTLSQVNTTIVHSKNQEDLFRNICKGVVEHGKFLMAWVGLVDEATHRVNPVCHDGAEQGYLANIVISADDIPEGRGPTGTSIRENRVCYINNFLTDERIRPWSEAASKRGFQSSVGLPLRLKGKVIGALTMYTGAPDFFDAEQLALMDEMSSDISFALDNISHETERKHAEEKIDEYVKQLESAMQGTLLAVSNMVEQRDPYTSGHERRVGIIAADIAREMGWPEEKCRSLQWIGLVHDLGKIAIPAEILSKPSLITPIERMMIQTHPEKGYEILKDVGFSLPIAEIIYQHHERMDGTGYPRGLKGDEILPEARILAVADVLESMASHRPYRPALGIETAIKEIEAHRGTWFDATAVDAILTLIREKGYRLPD